MKTLPKFVKDDYFKVDTECHVAAIPEHLDYYLQYGKENKAYGITRIMGLDQLDLPETLPLLKRDATPDTMIDWMNKKTRDFVNQYQRQKPFC